MASARAFALALLLALALPSGVWAQPITSIAQESSQPDDPRGAPYHTDSFGSSGVPLRDYLSSRIDQLRSELFDKIDAQQKIIDERDHQYAQRFDAQQEALSAALLAQKEAVANALSAAKEAVTKAEDASNKRFDSVNEFRSQLDDQAGTFLTKDAGEARFKAVEDKVDIISRSIANTVSTRQGADSLWAYLIGAIGLIIVVVTFGMRFMNQHKET